MSEEVKPENVLKEESLKVDSAKVDFAEAFERIKSQDKHISDERKKLQDARKDLEMDKQAAEELKLLKKLRDEDPLKLLEHFKLTPQEVGERLKSIGENADPNVRRLSKEIEELKSILTQVKSEIVIEKENKGKVKIKAEIAKTIKEGGFDIIESLGQEQDVEDYMKREYDKTGEIIDVSIACEAVANTLADTYSKVASSQYLVKKASKQPEVQSPKEGDENIAPNILAALKSRPRPSPGLSHKMTQSSEVVTSPTTPSQRKAAAAQWLTEFRSTR